MARSRPARSCGAAGRRVSGLRAARRHRPAARTICGRPPGRPRPPRRHARRQSVTRVAVFVATVAYCGYFPIAPGTVGSAAGLLVYVLVWWTQSPAVEVALIVAVFAA